MPKTQKHKPDFILLFLSAGLIIFGLLMVYNASVVSAFESFGNKYYFLKLQSMWALLGLVIAFIVYRIDYHFWQKFTPLLIFASIILLLAVFIPGLGIKAYGAQRWLDLKLFLLQPAELTKLAYIFYLSSLLSKKIKLTPFLVVTGLIVGIVMLQKDLGTAVIISLTGLSVYFLAGGAWWQIAFILPVGGLLGAIFILSSSYRRSRLLTFLDPTQDPLGRSYHINQVLIALGSGGLFGLGLGQSRQKYQYLPEVTTDSIFAVIGEELGFVGACLLVLVFLVLIQRGLRISGRSPDRFGQILAGGITAWLGIQIFTNLAAMSALLPLTGVPLPFISYGGSSLVVAMVGIALLLNISKQTFVSSPSRKRQKKSV